MDHLARLLFHELADMVPADREKLFVERQITPELRAEVESLLSFDAESGAPLADCVSDTAQEMLRSADARKLGDCGPYRLVRLLGSGGMGAVYLAQRSDGEIQQQVAVKVLRAGADRPAWRGRFLKERQLLATLNHPSIARVIDAGHTAENQPYLVMEYVEGVPIDAYATSLDLRDKLTLFLRICEGVSHAHRHLIIHRDLKPSNILVDSSGQPKLLDFGIAKMLDETGDATQTVERLLTPNYASPEQLRGGNQTTATDIYSLGVVLCKLLTGESPQESGAIFSRLGIPTDVGYILRKAMRDEPEERYATVEAFAGDIRAFLESRPVQARSGNAWYRTRKFLRRYWAPAAAAALVVGSLSAGLYIANRERVIAQRRFAQLRQLSSKVFDLDRSIRNLPGSTEARRRLVSASVEYLESLSSGARGDPDLAQELGEAYERVAKVQGVPDELNLGEFAQAEASLKKADAFTEVVLASRPQNGAALRTSAAIAHDRMILAQSEGRRDDALAYAGKSAQRLEAFLRRSDVPNLERSQAAITFGNIALAYSNMHLYSETVRYAQRSIGLARLRPASEGGGVYISGGLSVMANALRYQGDLEGALQAAQEARKIAEQAVFPNETVRMINTYGVLLREGLILGEDGGVNMGRPEEAIQALQKAVDLTAEAARKSPNDYTSRTRFGNCAVKLANILRHSEPGRALVYYDGAIRRLNEVQNNLTARRQLAAALADSSYALRSLHRAPEAKQRIDAAFAILKDTKDYPAGQVPFDRVGLYNTLVASADYEAGHGDPQHAVKAYQDLLDKVMAAKPEPLTDLRDVPNLSLLYQSLARLYRRTGDPARAESMESRRLDLWRHWDGKLPHNAFVHRQLEAASLR